jgi:cellulose 1,4-beta-cellobiosidase
MRRRLAALAATATLATGAGAAATAAHAAATPRVAYTMTTNWGTGFQVQLTITPGDAVTSWTVSFDAADGQTALFAAYADMTQVGRRVTLANRPFNGTVAAGGSVNVLMQFTNPTLTNVPPASFVVNGQTAAYTPQPYLVSSASKPVVPEGGSSRFTVRLSQAPATNVRVTVGNSNASPSALTYTPADWNVPQTVTVTSPEDADTTDQSFYVPLQQNGGTPFYASYVLMPVQDDNDN